MTDPKTPPKGEAPAKGDAKPAGDNQAGDNQAGKDVAKVDEAKNADAAGTSSAEVIAAFLKGDPAPTDPLEMAVLDLNNRLVALTERFNRMTAEHGDKFAA